ncbi:hypothetical protein TWF694_011762 [Orbilia ellipsospora]|uniref:Uncharacterized protein n=1 Tax=Orbilia ellipsospora TaxID=2528407 RepID=A0AAV9X677_9PEZI
MVSVKILVAVSAGLFGLQTLSLPIPNPSQITTFKHTAHEARRSSIDAITSDLEKRIAEPAPLSPHGNSRIWRHARSVKPAAPSKSATEGISSTRAAKRAPTPSANERPAGYNSRIWRHARNVAPKDTKSVEARAPVSTPNPSKPISRVWRHAKKADVPKVTKSESKPSKPTPEVRNVKARSPAAKSDLNAILQSSPAWRLAARATNTRAATTQAPSSTPAPQNSRVWRHAARAASAPKDTKTPVPKGVVGIPRSTTAAAPKASASPVSNNSRVWRHNARSVAAPKNATAEVPKAAAEISKAAPKAAPKVASAPAVSNSRVYRHAPRSPAPAPAPMHPLYKAPTTPISKSAAATSPNNSRVWRHAARTVEEAPKVSRSETRSAAPREVRSPSGQTSRVWRHTARAAVSESSQLKGNLTALSENSLAARANSGDSQDVILTADDEAQLYKELKFSFPGFSLAGEVILAPQGLIVFFLVIGIIGGCVILTLPLVAIDIC